MWIPGIIAIVLIIALILVYFSWSSTIKCGSAECFIGAANECGRVSFASEDDTGRYEYSIQRCEFTKKLIALSAGESEEIKKFLEGKSFSCSYLPGDFDERWILSVIGGLEKCDGELKDATLALIARA